jgi:hypothetical protein
MVYLIKAIAFLFNKFRRFCRLYSVVFDDVEDSSDDEDYVPPTSKSRPKEEQVRTSVVNP